jgi:predicted DNA-binding transcriptional regulator YafY
MADSLERITNLLALLLEARQPLTFEQITHDLVPRYEGSTSAVRAAFERDKAALREVGVHFETVVLQGEDAGRTAYVVDRNRYELRGLTLKPDEQQALQLAVAASRNADARFGLLKLGGEHTDDVATVSTLTVLDELPVLQQAASARASVTFHYRGKARTLDPYALLLREGRWYVIGFDHEHQQLRTYRVDRFDGPPEVGEAGAFERPTGLDVREVFPDDPKELGDEPRWAVVRVHPPRASLVAAELAAESVRVLDGGVVELDVPCTNLDAFRSWVLGLGAHAEVMSPPDVRAHIVEWLRAVAGAQ